VVLPTERLRQPSSRRSTCPNALGENVRNLGTLRFDTQGAREHAAFEDRAAWFAATEGFPIGPGLPVAASPQLHRNEHGESTRRPAISNFCTGCLPRLNGFNLAPAPRAMTLNIDDPSRPDTVLR
jgi:hypothetical protein